MATEPSEQVSARATVLGLTLAAVVAIGGFMLPTPIGLSLEDFDGSGEEYEIRVDPEHYHRLLEALQKKACSLPAPNSPRWPKTPSR